MPTHECSTNQERLDSPSAPIEQNTLSASNDLQKTALEYLQAGLSVFPSSKDKAAVVKWKAYQSERPTEKEAAEWWKDPSRWIAIACGKASGKLELIDFDQKYCLDDESLFLRWKAMVEDQMPGLVDRLPHETSPSGGDHVYYRCSIVEGNKKLAQRPATELELKADPGLKALTLIETRGQGGYVVCAPSPGYKLVSGSLLEIPEVTPEEREVLLECARMFNKCVPDDAVVSDGTNRHKKATRPDLPGNVFAEKGDVRDVLVASGWTQARSDGERDYWTRPGKSQGVSATFHRELKLFHVFSSNASPFEPGKAYSPFSVYALLKHNGDYKAAAKDLAEQGYGKLSIRKSEKPTLRDVEEFLNEDYEFRRNVVTADLEMRRPGESTFRIVTDCDLNSIHRQLIHSDLTLNYETMVRTLRSDFSPEFDPFVSYFENLPTWDGTTDHVEALVDTVKLKNSGDKAVFKEYLTRWLVAQVACAIEPKIVNQTAIVLVGPQGRGKTTWLDRLAPPGLEDYRYQGVIDPDSKDTLVYLTRKILINLDELETFSKGDIGRLKSIMTQSHISVRLPYNRVPEQFTRRASFVGSVNHGDFLNDPTGSRRFLVFEVTSADGFHAVDMNGVYAQAYALFKSGHRYYFDQEDIDALIKRNRKYIQRGYEHELLNELCSQRGKSQGSWFTATGLAEAIKQHRTSFVVDKASVRNLGYALNHEGYKKKSSKGTTSYFVKWK